MRRTPALAGALALLLSVLVGCTGQESADRASASAAAQGTLPEADGFLKKAVSDTSTLKSARFSIITDGSATTLGISSADGVITREGDAKGTARLDQADTPMELQFVVKGETLYVNGLTGGWQSVPLSAAASVYDPTAILDPQRGVAEILRTATGKTEARETVNGVATYRIKATLSGKAVGTLVPGVTQDVVATLWVDADGARQLLHKVSFPVPGQAGTVTVTFSDFDAPVTISAP
jgi:lipoprotein LprG